MCIRDSFEPAHKPPTAHTQTCALSLFESEEHVGARVRRGPRTASVRRDRCTRSWRGRLQTTRRFAMQAALKSMAPVMQLLAACLSQHCTPHSKCVA
eukprot:1433289-Rhodomonas_salina.1